MRRQFLGMVLSVIGTTFSASAAAQLGSLVGLTGGSGSGTAPSAETLVKKYVTGTKKVMAADSLMLSALGLKNEAEKSELAAKNLTEGATSSNLEDAAKVQTESSKALQDKLASGATIKSAQGKKTFSRGLLELARGIKDYTGMGADVKGYKPSITSLGAVAGAAVFVVKSLPDSVTNLTSTLKRAINFAKANNIEVPADATSVL